MDAFFAAIEQRDTPDLRGKPIAVGGGGRRGVVSTASYEARKYGVHSAMPGFKARQLCPQIIFVPSRFDAYKEASRKIRTIFESYTDLVEPLSLDEAFLDVTDNKINEPIATKIAEEIRGRVWEETQLTCSAGVSYCKFLAKIASDINKPDGLKVIRPEAAEAFLEQLPIQKFFGIGKVTAKKMKALGIHTGADLKKWNKLALAQRFGKTGSYYYNIVRGIDHRPVKPSRIRKSIGVERTLRKDLSTYEEIRPVLDKIINKFFERLQKANNYGRTLTLKLKTHDFQVFTRAHTHPSFVTDKKSIQRIAYSLLKENMTSFEKIRLIGLTASNLQEEQRDNKYGIQLQFDFEQGTRDLEINKDSPSK